MSNKFYLFNRKSPFSYIVGGIAFFSIATILRSITGIDLLYAGCCCVGYALIFYGLFHLRHKLRFRFSTNPLYYGLLILYLILCLIMIVRGYTDNEGFQWISTEGAINFHLFNPTYLLCYFMPFIALIDPDEYDFRPIVKWSEILSWFLIIAFIIFYKDILQASIAQSKGIIPDQRAEDFMAYGYIYYNVALISLCRKYTTRKVWLVNTAALIVTLAINLLAGRRGDTLISASLLVLNIVFFVSTFKFRYRLIGYMISILVMSCTIYITASTSSAFAYIQSRAMVDNRSDVDEDLMSQMSVEQAWFGKGLNGRYYHNLHLSYDVWGGYRYVSETGYYNLVLKGGYTYAWLYILVIAIPALRGLFKSKNLLLKAIASIMILSLLELYPFGHLSFNLKFMVIWMGVTMCMNKRILKMSDSQIQKKYFAR